MKDYLFRLEDTPWWLGEDGSERMQGNIFEAFAKTEELPDEHPYRDVDASIYTLPDFFYPKGLAYLDISYTSLRPCDEDKLVPHCGDNWALGGAVVSLRDPNKYLSAGTVPPDDQYFEAIELAKNHARERARLISCFGVQGVDENNEKYPCDVPVPPRINFLRAFVLLRITRRHDGTLRVKEAYAMALAQAVKKCVRPGTPTGSRSPEDPSPPDTGGGNTPTPPDTGSGGTPTSPGGDGHTDGGDTGVSPVGGGDGGGGRGELPPSEIERRIRAAL